MKAIPSSIIALLFTLAAGSLHADQGQRAEREPYRLWTDRTERHLLYAAFERLDNASGMAFFRKSDGQQMSCPWLELLPADRAYIKARSSGIPPTLASSSAAPVGLLPAPRPSSDFQPANMQLRISKRVLESVAERTVSELTPIQDCILDTAIFGSGWTTGNVNVALVPSHHCAVFDILFRGTVLSDTVGFNGPVTIYNDGVTHLISRTRVAVGSKGLSMYGTISRAHNRSFTKGLETRFSGLIDWIVKQFAEQRLQRDRPLADAIGADHAEIQFNDRMNDELGDQVREINDRYRDEVRAPLQRLNLFPDALRFSSNSDELLVRATLNNGQPVEHQPPPATTAADIHVGVHQSFVNTAIARALGGKTVSESEFRRQMGDLLGELNIFEDRSGQEDVRISLHAERPITVRYQDNTVTVTFRGTEYYLQDSTWPAMNVIIHYSLEQTPEGLKMTRVGLPEVQPPRSEKEARSRLALREILVRRLLMNRLALELKREILLRELPLSELLAEDLGRLTLVDGRTEQGWLLLAVEYSD